MSLTLNRGTKPDGLSVSTLLGTLSVGAPIMLGDYEISMEDFLIVAEYVLTNTDLVPDDQRLQFVECVKSMKEVDGYNQGGKRLKPSVLPVRN